MRSISKNIFTKLVVVLVMLIMIGASFFSMSFMPHRLGHIEGSMYMHQEKNNSTDQSNSCIHFHFTFLEQFSHGFTYSEYFIFLIQLLSLIILSFLPNLFFAANRNYYTRLKVRLRQLKEEVPNIFLFPLHTWLCLFEKRDPSYVFALT